jgi:thiosulfate/3-mercaptopyruvate sulfurtransferase
MMFSSAAQAARVLPGPLVDSAWLAANLDQVVVLEVDNGSAGAAAYAVGHVPGAAFVNFGVVRANRVIDGVAVQKMVPLPEAFEGVMQSAGVNQDSSVVITFAGKTTDDLTFATRLFWTLKYFGHDDVALLDGGKAQWIAAGYPLSTAAGSPLPGNFIALKEEADMYATTAEVVDAIEDANIQLVDVRPLAYYLGLIYKSDYVYAPGHVPTAKNAPLELFVASEAPLTFLDPEQIAAALEAVGVNPEGANIAVCNSGHTASGLWFVMHELLGNKRSELYDGSMHEWTLDPSRPLTTMQMD